MGNKYKLLSQIVPLFPKDIDIFVDMFCGGLDVSLNVEANKKICNDKESHIIDFYSNIQSQTGEEVHNKLLEIVEKYKLDMTNAEGYNSLRSDYNKENNWVLFYSLIAHSFNHQIRYNNKGEFNMPFGKNRSCYNKSLQSRLKDFVDRVDNKFNFSNLDFRTLDLDSLTDNSFVYCDPPYIITTATYNENGGWTEKDERDLLDLLDKLHEKGIKFGLSNVMNQNGKTNEILKEWSKKYTVHNLNYNYGNSSYHKKDRSVSNTEEVYICNY
jgi:DNA adenine methylase Dam